MGKLYNIVWENMVWGKMHTREDGKEDEKANGEKSLIREGKDRKRWEEMKGKNSEGKNIPKIEKQNENENRNNMEKKSDEGKKRGKKVNKGREEGKKTNKVKKNYH